MLVMMTMTMTMTMKYGREKCRPCSGKVSPQRSQNFKETENPDFYPGDEEILFTKKSVIADELENFKCKQTKKEKKTLSLRLYDTLPV